MAGKTSKLFAAARRRLTPGHKPRLAAALRHLKTHRDDKGVPIGPRLVENLRRESHLTGDEPFGHPARFGEFLVCWADRHGSAADEAGRSEALKSSCENHQLAGTFVPGEAVPETLVRFVCNGGLLVLLVEEILGYNARADLEGGRLEPFDAIHQLRAVWDPALLDTALQVGPPRHRAVFATFELDDRLSSMGADAVVDALALTVPPPQSPLNLLLLEFRYPSSGVAPCRFPTVADAALTPGFEPAEELAPDPSIPETCYGWTRPTGGQAPMPEIVHGNAPMRLVAQPPRLVGRLT